MKTIRERFWSKVRIPENVTDEDCWDWVGMMGHHNYGRMIASGRVQFAHRVSYEIYRGKIPEGLILMHSCDCPSCVNPSHLRPGTRTDNMRDMNQKGRHRETAKTHCVHGHPLFGKNLTVKKYKGRTWRICRACRAIYNKKYHAARNAMQLKPASALEHSPENRTTDP